MIEQLAEALEVYHLALTEEFYDLVHVGVVAYSENVVVGSASFLLRRRLLGLHFVKFSDKLVVVIAAVGQLLVNDNLFDKLADKFLVKLCGFSRQSALEIL